MRGPHGPNQRDIGSGSSAVEFSTVRRKLDESPRSAVGDLAGLVKPRGMAKQSPATKKNKAWTI